MPKILIIRFSSIGDIVLTTPVIRCLKLQLDAEVHFLTKQSYRSVVAANPHLTAIFTIENKVSEVLSELKAEQYDYVIDLHKNIRSAQVKFALSAHSFAFNKLNVAKWLIVNLGINRLPDVHIVDRYLATVKSLGVTNDGQGLDYFIPKKDRINTVTFFKQKAESYYVFAIGAAHATKRLPTEKIIKICKRVKLPIVLIGGPDESSEGAYVARSVGERCINLCGKISINQSASLMRQSAAVITHDTGMMHIAAAFRKPIVSVWGSTIPEFGMYPYLPTNPERNMIVEVKDLKCRPCSKIGYDKCPQGHFKCMREIDTVQVIRHLSNG